MKARRVGARARRRSTAGRRGAAVTNAITARSLLDRAVEYLTPKQYDERAAALDALGGRSACRHGHWPHQGAICGWCATEALLRLLEPKAGP